MLYFQPRYCEVKNSTLLLRTTEATLILLLMCGYEAICIEIGFILSLFHLLPIKVFTKIFIAFKIAPTETGVVRDARAVYDWVAAR